MHRGALNAALSRVLESGRYVLGPEHDAFEDELARYLDARHCVGVASGLNCMILGVEW